MYHFEAICGESPCCATVKAAPFESDLMLPVDVKESETPLVKSMLTDFPRAGSAGHPPEQQESAMQVQVRTSAHTLSDRIASGVCLCRHQGREYLYCGDERDYKDSLSEHDEQETTVA